MLHFSSSRSQSMRAVLGATIVLITFSVTRPTWALVSFDQNVTPAEILFGSGNANGSFTTDRQGGIELALRGKLRFDQNNQAQNIFNSNGDGTYTFAAGAAPGGFGFMPNAASTPVWSFEWSVNTDFDDSSGLNLSDLTYEMGIDFDPGIVGQSFLVFDPITPGASAPFYDHSIGTNSSTNPGATAGDQPTYASLLANNNVAQNSWNMEFFNDAPFNTFVASDAGQYDFYLAAFSGATEVARVDISIIVVEPTETNTGALSDNGWYSDDTRADGSGSESAGTNLISDTLTADPEATASGSPAHDADILNQIQFIAPAVPTPSGTHPGCVHLNIAPGSGSGKSQISHRKDDGTGHAPGSAFGPGMSMSFTWMGDGTVSVTPSVKFGFKTSEFATTGVSARTGENAWDKVLIYEPGNLNGGTSDGAWHTDTVDFSNGKWWFFDRTAGAGTIGTPLTLSAMSTSSTLVGAGPKTIADVYALITAPGAHITSAQVGIGSGNAGGSVYVNQFETNFYRAGEITTFGPDLPVRNLTQDLYYSTITAAVADADPGDVIKASSGTYSESGILIDKALTLLGDGIGATTIDAGGAIGLFVRADDVTLNDMTITGASQSLRLELVGGTIDSLKLQRVQLTNSSVRGIEISNATTVTNLMVEECDFTSTKIGLRVSSSGHLDGAEFLDSTFTSNDMAIYEANDGGTSTLRNMTVRGCTFTDHTTAYGSQGTAIFLEEVQDSVIEENSFVNNRRDIQVFKWYQASIPVSNFTIQNNTMSGTTDSHFAIFNSEDTSGQTVFDDVLFVNNDCNGNFDTGKGPIYAGGHSSPSLGGLGWDSVVISKNSFQGVVSPAKAARFYNPGVPASEVLGGTQVLNVSGNYWGTNDSAALDALMDDSSVTDFTPMIDNGSDQSADPGYQPDLSSLTVHSLGAQSGATSRIQEGIDLVSGSTVNVLPGTYPGNLSLVDDLTLQSTGGAGVTTIAGAGGCAVSIDGDNVTIDGFTITNPTGTNAICSDDHSVIAIRNNVVTNVGGPTVGGNHHAVLIESSAAAVDDVTIEDNQINDVTGSEVLAAKGSASAITVGFSNGDENVTNLVIQNNTISNINGYTATFANGGRGAYGILINHGTGVTGKTVGAQLLNNTITDLEGLWAHGIGLEGNTPNALLQGNKVSDLTDHKSPSDAIGVQIEENASADTVEIHYNSFTNLAVGIQNVSGSNTTVNAENNYWGSDTGPNDVSDDGGETTDIDYLSCTGDPASEFNADGTGSAVNDTSMEVVDYCPWLLGQGKLALEIAGTCPDDANAAAGYQIEVQLWMRDLLDPATGFQAFVTYETGKLAFRDDLSSYSALPFQAHIGTLATADSGGLLSLNGFEAPGMGMGGTTADSLLATLVFDVNMSCTTTSLGFDTSPVSELSFEGDPLMTGNQGSPTVTLDDEAPTITPDTPSAVGTCYPSAAAAELDALANTSVSDTCGAVNVTAVAVGTCSATVTITATDDCGNESTYVYNTRIDDEDPMVTMGTIDTCYDTQVEAENAAIAATTATDNCTASGMLNYSIQDVTGGCDKMITVRVTDECNNSTDVVYATRVDNLAPMVTAGSIDTCYASVAAAEAAAISATSASDNCLDAPVKSASTVGTCTATITVTATDSCGNSDFVEYNTRIDDEAPVVTCSSVMTPADAGACTAEVILSATALDNCDGAFMAGDIDFIIDIDHDGIGNGADDTVMGSGTPYIFPSGATDVRATATDFCGNVGTCDYTVTVDSVNLATVTVVLDAVAFDGVRNIRFTAKGPLGCATAVCEPVTFVSTMGGIPSTGIAQIAVPCGDWDSICAKDEQHTLIASTPLVLNGVEFDAPMDLVLYSGDTDNDSDVDINDVTLFIAQFGMSYGGLNPCPYNNVRDSDFSLNGVVGGEDFSILQPNWLLFSTCGCPSPISDDDETNIDVRPLKPGQFDTKSIRTRLSTESLSPEVSAHADFDRDGEITYKDIRIFENIHGFAHDLSESLRRVESLKSEDLSSSLERREVGATELRPRR